MSNSNTRHMLYMASFFLVFVLDPTAFSLQLASLPKIPFGMLGLVFVIFIFFSEVAKDFAVTRLSWETIVLWVAFLNVFILALIGQFFELLDFWTWTKNIAYFALGTFLYKSLAQERLGFFYKLAFSLAIGASGWLWYSMAGRIFVTGEVDSLNYLHVSDSLVVVAIVLMNSLRTLKARGALLLLASAALYFVGSRFGLLGFIGAGLLIFFRRLTWVGRISLLVVLIFGILSLVGFVDSLGLEINDNRFVRLFFHTEYDTSLNARLDDDEFGRDVFFANPFFGGGYKFYMVNGEGMYAHNALSLVYEFGVFGVALVFAIGVFVFKSIRCQRLGGNQVDLMFGLVALLFLAAFSKYYMWWGYFFIVGYLFSFCQNELRDARRGMCLRATI